MEIALASPSPTVTNANPKPAVKPVLLIRPTSSHEDLASGFSFSKAKPPQSLNLGHQARPAKWSRDYENTPNPIPEKSPNLSSTIFLPAQEHEASRIPSKESPRTEPQEAASMLNDASIVPFRIPPGSPATEASSDPNDLRFPCPKSSRIIAKDQGDLHQDIDQINKSQVEYPDRPQVAAGSIQGDDCPRLIRANPTDQRLNTDGGKEETLQPRKGKHANRSTFVSEKAPIWTAAEEDAIHMLMFNREKLLRHCETMLAQNRAQEDQIAGLKRMESTLKAELQDTCQCLERKDAELKEMQALQPKLQARVKRFKDYLNGLYDEHVQLKDTGYKILETIHEAHDEYQSMKADLQATTNTFTTAQETVKQQRESWIREIADRDQQIGLGAQMCLKLKEQVEQAQTVADNEAARNERLESNAKQTRSDHEQLMSVIRSHQNELVQNIVRLLERPVQVPATDCATKDIIPMLQRCAEILEGLQQKETLGPRHLDDLLATVEEKSKLILESMGSCEDIARENIAVSQQIVQKINGMMHEKALTEQLHLSGVRQTELLKQLQTEQEARLAFEEQANQARERGFENVAEQKAKDDEIATLKAEVQRSNVERLEIIARQEFRDEEIATARALQVKRNEEEIRENLKRQQIRDNELERFKYSLTKQSEEENLANLAKQKVKDDEMETLKASLIRKSKDESRENDAQQKLLKDEIAKLKAALVKKSTQESVDNIAMHRVKDNQIAELKAALEGVQRCSPKSSHRANVDPQYDDQATDDESSQVEEIPRNLTDIMNGTQGSWPSRPFRPWPNVNTTRTVTNETVAELFSTTPGRASGPAVPENHETFKSSQSMMMRQQSTKVPEIREVEDSQPQIGSNPDGCGRDLDSQVLNKMTAHSPSLVSVTQSDLALEDLTASNTATNALGAKPNTKAVRKRTAVVADLAGPFEARPARKTTRSSARIHVSIIADSQSPKNAPSQTFRPAKMTTISRKGKASMYQKKFDQYH